MELSSRIVIVIYVWMFIFAKLLHCIDVSHEETAAEVLNESTNIGNTESNSPPDQITKQWDSGNIQLQETSDAMQMCNQSFPTPKESLIELNLTGTLPDEVDVISICFVRCYLDRMGILKNDIVDRERGMELDLAKNEDILDDCSKESRDQKDMCMRAYFFIRCVAITNLVYDAAK